MMQCACLLLAVFLSNAAFAEQPPRVIVPRGIGWGDSAWPDNGPHDMAQSSKYAYLEVDILGETRFNTDALMKYKQAGHIVFCYFSIGTLEEGRLDGQCKIKGEKATCKKNNTLWTELVVRSMGDWPELWLDISNPKLRDIMGNRMRMMKEAGCHGVEPDNIDCYSNPRCAKSKSAQLSFNKWTVDYAHSLGLAVVVKNDYTFLEDITDYDVAVVESSFKYNESHSWAPFAKTRSVMAIEYRHADCKRAEALGMSLIYCTGSDNCAQTEKMTHCRVDSSFPEIKCTSGAYSKSKLMCESQALSHVLV